jgi:hypothetical protein
LKNRCKNCKSVLYGKFCSSCGQRENQKISFREISKDFFDDIFDYDARLFNSIKYLLFKPGFLTLQYWEGKRVKYLQPFKVYLMTSLLYYLVNSLFKIKQKSIIGLSQFSLFKTHKNTFMDVETFLSSYSQEIELLLFTPITGLVLMLLYKKTNHAFLHHMIASVHLSSFIFLTLSIILILTSLLSGISNYIFILNLIIPFYAIMMLSYVYKESIASSFFKCLLIFFTVILRNLLLYVFGFLYLTL